METQEQILKEQRLKIETLRYRILLRYYELLLTLDVMTQPNEVKTLMGYINTLERYAKKYETKPVKKKSGKRKEHIDEIPVTDENTGSEETDLTTLLSSPILWDTKVSKPPAFISAKLRPNNEPSLMRS